MEPFDRSESRRKPVFSESSALSRSLELGKPAPPKRSPRSYRVCDAITEGLIYFMVVFTPWAFGTTQGWSIWTMNVTGYLLGGLLGTKWVIRWSTGYRPTQWGAENSEGPGGKVPRFLTLGMALLTVVTLGYCLASALNARAAYLPTERRFDYYDHIEWLPHSYDSLSTWSAFWSYLGLACFFWALRDWLLGKTRQDRHERQSRERTETGYFDSGGSALEPPSTLRSLPPPHDSPNGPTTLPARLRRLLWVLSVNGALLALEAILQRLSGTNALLWLVVPRFNNTGETQFGPYAYRSNAASYLNLAWPVCLGFWMLLRRAASHTHRIGARVGGGSYVMLLPCAVLMAAAPVFSTSRGGAAVSLSSILLSMAIIFFAARREAALVRASMLCVFLAILGFSAYLGWEELQERLENIFVDNLSDRPQIYTNALPMVSDFPTFGTGPGTFGSIYQLYKEPNQTWDAYAHNDFLETRITFGAVGFALLTLLFSLVLVRWVFRAGIACPWEFAAFAWLALGGCLFHAEFDFPFQIYSILFLFLLVCSVLFCLSRK